MKTELYERVVVLTMIGGAKQLEEKGVTELNLNEIECQRSKRGLIRMERVTNEEVNRRLCATENLSDSWIKKSGNGLDLGVDDLKSVRKDRTCTRWLEVNKEACKKMSMDRRYAKVKCMDREI